MSLPLNKKIFVDVSKKSHSFKFDYSKVEYKNARTKVCIICVDHGNFWQRADYHMKGGDCPVCGKIKGINKLKLQTEGFKNKAFKIHKNVYDYSLSKCQSSRSIVKIICKIHGEFEQSVHNHLQGSGCPRCQCLAFSSGELRIKNWLNENKIFYVRQKKFDGCKNKRKLSFDFYLPEINTCIEYDGKQHFDKNSKFYSDVLLKNDNRKNKYCLENKIRLIRISFYNFSKIEKILKNKIEEVNFEQLYN